MGVIRTWLADFDWEVDSTSEVTTVEFKPDSTLDSDNGGVGTWVETDRLVLMATPTSPGAVFAAVCATCTMPAVASVGPVEGVWRGRRASGVQIAEAHGSFGPANPPGATAQFIGAAAEDRRS